MSFKRRLGYARKVLPGMIWQGLRPVPRGPLHLILALADHFEPAIDPSDGQKRAPRTEQERRVQLWCSEYPKLAERWRDPEGRPFVHTYFYPAEQYDEGLVELLAELCHDGWGELEVHLHHGISHPDTAENTRRLLTELRDRLAFRHHCLATEDGSDQPRYAFVHGDFALANCAGGPFCGVDSEMKILAETGCYADFTFPAAPFHPAQIPRINSLYECALPLEQPAPQRRGRDLQVGRKPEIFPLMVEGPLVFDFRRSLRSGRAALESASITSGRPMTLERLSAWKQARIHVRERPDWLFIKLHCHGMDPTQKEELLGAPMRRFLQDLVDGARARNETLHFVTAREMTNIILAACDGKEGNPGDYRDYRFKRFAERPLSAGRERSAADVRR
ncbi:MAG: hypothetical protein WCC22_11810 [Terriglobales bacterium]